MSYLALYRKYRPKTFDEVYGQSAIVQTLRNQITSQRIGHAYLFSGPEVQERRVYLRYLLRPLTVLHQLTEARVGNVHVAR